MADNLFVDIVSPEGSVFRGDARALTAPGSEGSFQILKDHAPMIAAFAIGRLTVKVAEGQEIGFVTSGGFLEVLGNEVTVLAETAEPVDQIDIDRARDAEARAVERLSAASGEDRDEAAVELERARNRLRAAMGSVGGR